MSASRTLLFTTLLASLAALVPGPASAAAGCGVAQGKAVFETPEVQVYPRRAKLVACVRATGRARVVGVRSNDGGIGWSTVDRVIAGRWLLVHTSYTFAESPDAADDTLIDLRTGGSASLSHGGDAGPDGQVAALPGVLVVTGGDAKGVQARFTTGRIERLSAVADATGLAAASSRVYWREPVGGQADPRTASYAFTGLPGASAERTAPLAAKIGRCVPKRRARLVLHDDTRVVTRTATDLLLCTRTTGRQRRVGPAGTKLVALSATALAYTRDGVAGALALSSSARTEMPAPAGAVALDGTIAAAAADGLRVASVAAPLPKLLTPELVSDVALGLVPADEVALSTVPVAYWRAADGIDRSVELR